MEREKLILLIRYLKTCLSTRASRRVEEIGENLVPALEKESEDFLGKEAWFIRDGRLTAK